MQMIAPIDVYLSASRLLIDSSGTEKRRVMISVIH